MALRRKKPSKHIFPRPLPQISYSFENTLIAGFSLSKLRFLTIKYHIVKGYQALWLNRTRFEGAVSAEGVLKYFWLKNTRRKAFWILPSEN